MLLSTNNFGFSKEKPMKIKIGALLLMAAASMAVAGGNIIPTQAQCGNGSKEFCQGGGVVVDYDKKLMWQDEPYGDMEDGAYSHNRSAGKAGRWSYAQGYCSTLNYAGFNDWRLPRVGELVDLFDTERGFKNQIGVDFWSSTPSDGNKYWSVYAVVRGTPYEHKKSDTQYIRCVRCIE